VQKLILLEVPGEEQHPQRLPEVWAALSRLQALPEVPETEQHPQRLPEVWAALSRPHVLWEVPEKGEAEKHSQNLS
jgi:hypothetical protein